MVCYSADLKILKTGLAEDWVAVLAGIVKLFVLAISIFEFTIQLFRSE